jgi:stearoyl-CoA desaturase (delta-9 desaturase)
VDGSQDPTVADHVETEPADDVPLPASAGVRLATLLSVVVPFLGLLVGVVLPWGWGPGWWHLGLFLGMFVLTGVGITVGFHRLFTHRSFETNSVVQFLLGVLGSMAVQGPLLQWAAYHRRHHQHSDRRGDPHSPHCHGRGVLGVIRGMWHAHLGWIFTPDPPNLSHYVRDLRQSRVLRTVSALFPLWVTAGLLLPAVAGGLLWGNWTGAFLGFLWGGLVRIFFVHHVTWSVNSVCHLWGRQPYRGGDHSRNNFLFGVLAFGEGWHNNHHAFPTSARHGLRWWQPDLSYAVIRTLAVLRLARNVRVPTKQALALRASAVRS